MFRQDVCARCLSQISSAGSHSSLPHLLFRNVSKLAPRARSRSAARGPPLSDHGASIPIAKFSRKNRKSAAEIAKAYTKASTLEAPSNPARTNGVQRSTSASNRTDHQSSLNESEDARVVFNVSDEAKSRLQKVSQHIERYYERKRARNSILKSLQSSDWQTDWRTSFDMLRIEYVLGKYVEAAPYPTAKLRDHWTRWDREMSPCNIPEPQIFSKPAFHLYVQRILSLQSIQPLQRLLYPSQTPEESSVGSDHVSQVSKKIESIFRNESFIPFFTTEAFEDALRFMIRHNRQNVTRQLLNTMIENKVKIRTSTFNLFFSSAAFHNDLRFFTYILKLKQSLGIPSDAHTWASYLKTLLSTRAKTTVFWEMDKLGLFKDPVALQGCIAEIIDIELQKHAKLEDPFQPVVARLDAQFGPQWVSAAAANKICTLLGASGHIEQIPNVLEVMESRGIRVTSDTLSVLVHQASLMGDNKHALRVAKLFQSRYNLLPRARDFEYLFKAAWSTHSYNTCHMLWRLACGFGFVTRGMQELVYRSLQCNTPSHPATPEERWKKEAGKVITFSRPRHPQLKTLVGYEDAAGTYVTDEARTEQRTLAASIVRRDLLTRLRGSFHGNWIPMYEAAVRRDENWAEKDVLMAKTLRWKLQRVIRLGTQTWGKRRKITGTTYRHVAIHSAPGQ